MARRPGRAGRDGRVFDVRDRDVAVVEGWQIAPSGPQPDEPSALGKVLHELVDAARPNADMSGRVPTARRAVDHITHG
jgi:hypothetical protein